MISVMVFDGQDANYQLNPMLKLAMEYATRFSITTNREVAEQMSK
jgi:hypothetical protein